MFFVAGAVVLFGRAVLGASFLALVVLVFLTASGPPAVVLTLMDESGRSVIDVAGRSFKGTMLPDAPSKDSRIVDAALTRRPCLVGARSLGCGVLLREAPCRYLLAFKIRQTRGCRAKGERVDMALRVA